MKFINGNSIPAKSGVRNVLARAFGLLLVLGLILGLAAMPALAVPLFSHAFYGSVYVDNAPGDPAVPEGTVVTAEISGVQYGIPAQGQSYGTVDILGQYGYPLFAFEVPGDDPTTPQKEGGATATNDIIQFIVYDNLSKIPVTTFPFNPGAHTPLHLPVTDNIPPSVTITPLTPDPTDDNTPTLTGTATDGLCNISSVEYKVDSGDWTPATASDGTFDTTSEGYTFITPILANGLHTVYVRATDVAGNTTAEVNYASDSFTVSGGTDITPPVVQSHYPTVDQTGVPIDVSVTVTFSEEITVVNPTGITIDGATGVTVIHSIPTSLTIVHDVFAQGTEYTVTINTGAVQDLAANPNTEYSWSFTTITGEVIPGDANGDGEVNALDITKIERIIAGLDPPTPGADANTDGDINALDITQIELIIAGLP